MDNPLYDPETRDKAKKERARLDSIKYQKLIGAFNRTFASVDGQMVLQYIMKYCCYQSPCMRVNPQTNESTSVSKYNEALRMLYLDMRRFIKPEILMKTEFTDILEEEMGLISKEDDEASE